MVGFVNFVYFCKSDVSVVQGNWFWHHSKVRMRLPVRLS